MELLPDGEVLKEEKQICQDIERERQTSEKDEEEANGCHLQTRDMSPITTLKTRRQKRMWQVARNIEGNRRD